MNLLESLRAFCAARRASVYLVGGTVRDLLLGRAVHDLDLAVRGSASPLARAFADQIGGAYFLMDESFDIARVILDRDETREVVDFARLRGANIEADLATRDFTVNAMAADALTWKGAAAELFDPFGGRADLEARRIRAVSDEVFLNDAVRLLRAARMEAELDFAVDEQTALLMRRDASRIESAASERVRDELMRILAAPRALRNLRRLDALDLLGRVLPEVGALRDVSQSSPHIYDVFEHSLLAAAAAEETERAAYLNLAQGAFGEQLTAHFAQTTSAERTRRQLLRLALLLHDIGKPATQSTDENGRIRFLGHEQVGAGMVQAALRRLRFRGAEIALCSTIVAHHLRPILLAQDQASPRAVYRFFRDTGNAGVDITVHAWCDQRATYGDAIPPHVEAAMQSVIGKLLDRYYYAPATAISPPLLLNGDEIMQSLNLKPGPRIGELLEALREAQALGQVTTRQEAFAFVARQAI